MSGWLYGAALLAQTAAAWPPEPTPTTIETPAVNPARMAAATRLLDMLNLERRYDTIFKQMIPVMTLQVFGSLKDNVKVPAILRADLAKPEREAEAERLFATETLNGFKAEYPSMKAATAREYAIVFTTDEMNELTAFYASPIGRKTLSVMPQLQAKMIPIGMQMGRKVGEAAFLKTIERMKIDTGKPDA